MGDLQILNHPSPRRIKGRESRENFAILILMCFGVDIYGSIFFGTLCPFCSWLSVSLPRLGNFPARMNLGTRVAACRIQGTQGHQPPLLMIGAWKSRCQGNSKEKRKILWWCLMSTSGRYYYQASFAHRETETQIC